MVGVSLFSFTWQQTFVGTKMSLVSQEHMETNQRAQIVPRRLDRDGQGSALSSHRH